MFIFKDFAWCHDLHWIYSWNCGICLLVCLLVLFLFPPIHSFSLSHHVTKGMEISLSMGFRITNFNFVCFASIGLFVLLLLDCLWTIQLALLLAIQWRNVVKKAKKKNSKGWWWLQGWVLVAFKHSLIFMVFQSPASVFVLIQWVLFLLACLFDLTSCFLQFNDKMWWGRSVT